MGKKKKSHPYQDFSGGHLFRLNPGTTIAATPWHDKERGLIDGLEAIDRAAAALLSAVDKNVPATSYILQRLEQIKELDFARDDFYPQLSQLRCRTHLLLEELRAEEERGDALPMRYAWWRFVFGIATIYRDLGGPIRVSKVSSANEDTAKHSKFAKFAHAELVDAVRPPDNSGPRNGRPLKLTTPEPWPSAVNGAVLVAELTAAIRKYVVLTENDALTVALWILHAYCFDAFACTPRLAVTSPEKSCGKTTLLDVLVLLVSKALATSNISAAALFRAVQVAWPTLLIDEADTFLGEREELRGILNSGHRAGGQVVRTVGDDFEPRVFSTHCPVAIAQIGKLPDTLADRAIHISMTRRAPGERVARFRHGRKPDLSEAARKAARWIADNAEAIRECDPNIPEAIFNRAADNWAPLLAVAEVIGGDRPARARQAASAAYGVEEELSRGAELLADIREAFEESGDDRMTSAGLVAALVAMPERP